jgi:hypothetical protein
MTRRAALNAAFLGAAGLPLPSYLRARATQPPAETNDKSVILIWLDGGAASSKPSTPSPSHPRSIGDPSASARLQYQGCGSVPSCPRWPSGSTRCRSYSRFITITATISPPLTDIREVRTFPPIDTESADFTTGRSDRSGTPRPYSHHPMRRRTLSDIDAVAR